MCCFAIPEAGFFDFFYALMLEKGCFLGVKRVYSSDKES